jgi:hypothetical protein
MRDVQNSSSWASPTFCLELVYLRGDHIWITLKGVYHTIFNLPYAGLSDYLFVHTKRWREVTEILGLRWLCETGAGMRASLACILSFLVVVFSGRTLTHLVQDPEAGVGGLRATWSV